MRLIRLVALVGSMLLLVATSVSLITSRSELYGQQDAAVTSASVTAVNSIETTLLRARAVVEVVSRETGVEEILSTFGDSAEACTGIEAATSCSGPDLAALDGFGDAAAESAAQSGAPVAVVDAASDSILVVARRDVTVILQLPLDVMVGLPARESIAELGTEVTVDTGSGDRDGSGAGGIRTVDDRRVVVTEISDPLDDGAVVVRASVADDVPLGADSPARYAVLFAIGTVLLALGGWTLVVERRQLERRATTDELTGLVNRREFERHCEDAIEMAGRFGNGLCIMLIDLNGFKQINDTRGHQVGDDVLKACSDRLAAAVRDTDLVGRWGGDEFVVLLPGLEDASAVRDSAERLGSSLSASPVVGDIVITGSVGAALYPRHGTNLEELMHAADVAMYEAKATGVVHRLADTIASPQPAPPPRYGGPERRRTIAIAEERERERQRTGSA